MPGIFASAAEPSGSAASNAFADEVGREAVMAAAGTSIAACDDCTLATVPLAKRATSL
jgi:hypothetical protein